MEYVILDLEWNAAYSKRLKGYLNEIIEFGAVKFNEKFEIIDSFSSFVKLQVGKKISSLVSSLTSIHDENLTGARLFMQVASSFKKWSEGCVIMTWGTSDIHALIENFRYFNGSEKVPFLDKYMDIQEYCQEKLIGDLSEQMGLNKAAEISNVDISRYKHHRAFEDSLIAMEICRKTMDFTDIANYIQDASKDEFYRKMTFKTSIVCDIEHPLVKEKSLFFICEKCGENATRLTKWQLKNKKFFADFLCKNCGHKFTGRVQIKEKYEGIVVNKKSISVERIEKPRAVTDSALHKMHLEVKNKVGILKFPVFEKEENLVHGFSTRAGGVSENEFAAMNLGFNRGDSDENVHKNYEIIAEALGIEKSMMVASSQDHGVNVKRVTKLDAGHGIDKEKLWQSVDGLMTDEKGITLVIYTADCVPLYFYDKVKGAIALSHAGWRGTVNDMAGVTVRKMQEEFGSDPKDIKVAIGPSICKKCFEVESDCANEFLKLKFKYAKDTNSFVEDRKNGKFHVDLWRVNELFLMEAGIKKENIYKGSVCSMCESDLIFSHRATKGKRGSNAAFMCLK